MGHDRSRDPLPVATQAKKLHRDIVERLQFLDSGKFTTCLEPRFRKTLEHILEQFEYFQKSVLLYSSMKCCCQTGCADCCFHWVEDVNSFEAEIIADYIKRNFPDKKAEIVKACKDDIKELERLDEIMARRLSRMNGEVQSIDEFDLLLSVFYQMKRPCPLLGPGKTCIIYPVRPLTCRMYLNLSDPSKCSPEYINEQDIATYLLDLEEDANEIIDQLHFRFQNFEDDTGLRSLLVKYLD